MVSSYKMPTLAMNDLTDGQATFLGWVPVTMVSVSPSVCGLVYVCRIQFFGSHLFHLSDTDTRLGRCIFSSSRTSFTQHVIPNQTLFMIS